MEEDARKEDEGEKRVPFGIFDVKEKGFHPVSCILRKEVSFCFIWIFVVRLEGD